MKEAKEQIEEKFSNVGKEFYHVLILDKSGSMGVRVKETIMGVNEQIQTIKDLAVKNAEQVHLATLVTFNYNVDFDLYCQPADKLKELTEVDYRPVGGTALNQAIFDTVTQLKKTLEEKDANTYKVFVTILTDGENNDYKISPELVKKLVEDTQAEGWIFSFIGCSQDTLEQAAALGIHKGYTVTMDASNMADTTSKFKSISTARAYYSSSVTMNSSEGDTLSFAQLDSLSDEDKETILSTGTIDLNKKKK